MLAWQAASAATASGPLHYRLVRSDMDGNMDLGWTLGLSSAFGDSPAADLFTRNTVTTSLLALHDVHRLLLIMLHSRHAPCFTVCMVLLTVYVSISRMFCSQHSTAHVHPPCRP